MESNFIVNVPFTAEQAKCHVRALCNRTKVMERKLNDLVVQIDECYQIGDIEKAQDLHYSFQHRTEIINMMKQEIARFRNIFGDVVNG